VAGPYQGLLYLQFALIAGLFLGAFLLLQALHESGVAVKPIAAGLLIAALAMVAFAASPSIRRPLNWLVAAIMLWTLVRMSASRLRPPHELNRRLIQGTAVSLAVISLLTYWTMGTIRETARRPDTVRGVISLHDEARTPAADRTP
jgi:hypothetical protein